MSEGLIDLTEATFEAQVKNGITLVDFWAPWCGPCRMQTPILERLAPKVAGKAVIAKVNVDESQELAARFGIMSIPTILIFKNGQLVQQFMAVQQEPKLLAAIEAAAAE
jgi:thioredoxin 1